MKKLFFAALTALTLALTPMAATAESLTSLLYKVEVAKDQIPGLKVQTITGINVQAYLQAVMDTMAPGNKARDDADTLVILTADDKDTALLYVVIKGEVVGKVQIPLKVHEFVLREALNGA